MANISKIKIPGDETVYDINANTVSGFTVGINVPSNAKFTDTNTKVTSASNHYAPAEDTSAVLSADAAGGGNATFGTTQLVTGVDIKRDAKGHVVGVGVDSIKLPAEAVTSVQVGSTSYSPSSGVVSLPAYPTTLPASDTTSTYSSTGTAPVNGKAVASAIGGLDGTVSGSAGAGKTLTAFSQTNGKVSATFGNISITKSQVSDLGTIGTAAAKAYTTSVTSGSSDLVTSGAVYSAIDALFISSKVGDMFICDSKTSTKNTWTYIPSADEPSGTVTSVTIKATAPIAVSSTSAITTSGTRTISHNDSGVTAGTYQSVTVDAKGHVTAGAALTSNQVTTALGFTPYDSTNPNGYTSNTGTITGIKMNNSSKGTSGVVDLGTVITAHQDISGKADKSATVSTIAYDTTNKKFTKTINGTTTNVAILATTSVGSASAGTAIAADDITAWSAGTLPSLTTTTISPITDITPTSGDATTATVSNGVLTITTGSSPLVSIAAAKPTNGVKVVDTWSAGTLPSLTYTARSIPNISVSSKTVATGFTTS